MTDVKPANDSQTAPETQPGTSRHFPAAEHTYLEEEYLFHEVRNPFGRVLSCFEFRRDGVPTVVNADMILQDGSSDIEVIGIVGTIYNKEGLFAQSGWFGGHDLDWFWARIKGIRWLEVRTDIRFRRGEKCVWLGTQMGEYAMLLPHDDYREMWESTVAGLGPSALSAHFRQWPPCGVRPQWWDARWKDEWPFEKEAGSKRRPSMDVQDYEATARYEDTAPGHSWELVGPRGEQLNQGEMRTNIGHRMQWVVRPDGGMTATHSLEAGNKKKDTKSARARGTKRRGRWSKRE